MPIALAVFLSRLLVLQWPRRRLTGHRLKQRFSPPRALSHRLQLTLLGVMTSSDGLPMGVGVVTCTNIVVSKHTIQTAPLLYTKFILKLLSRSCSSHSNPVLLLVFTSSLHISLCVSCPVVSLSPPSVVLYFPCFRSFILIYFILIDTC